MFKPEFVANALKVPPPKEESKRVWTDSRSVEPGDLFAAVGGEKFDGHNYVAEAARKGAIGALVTRKDFPGVDQLPPNFSLIQIENTTEALRTLAKAHRERLKTKIFAVAGSNGKTTTKEWIAYLLSDLLGKDNVFKTLKSNNSILGIALSLLQIRNQASAVIEIGIDEPGWMTQHLEVVQPNAGLLTMIGEEHLNRLKNIETVAEEELKLLEYLKSKNRPFAANIDSPFIPAVDLPTGSLTYSLEKTANIEGRYLAPNTLKAFGLSWTNPLPGRHNGQNLLAALAALKIMVPELSISQLRGLAVASATFRGEAHRGLWLTYEKGLRVFDDTYNANPESMERALETFLELSSGCEQTLILGDMLDLGEASERAHMRILNLALVSGAERVYLFGPQFSNAWAQAKRLWPKNARTNVEAFSKMEDLQESLKSSLKRDECFLLKGSRGMALERALDVFEDLSFNL